MELNERPIRGRRNANLSSSPPFGKQTLIPSLFERNGALDFQVNGDSDGFHEHVSRKDRFNHAIPPKDAEGPLPPIGVFWDLENVHVPRGKSALLSVLKIRNRFFTGHKEATFMCVCDINKENQQVIKELNDAQVDIMHVAAHGKNACDDKLRQSMRRFADTYGSGSNGNGRSAGTVMLLSRDINFASDLSDLRHRHNFRIILLCTGPTPEALSSCAHEFVDFVKFMEDIPERVFKQNNHLSNELLVERLPPNHTYKEIKSKLLLLCSNLGGKIGFLRDNRTVVTFATPDAAARAKKRMEGELVFGSKIFVTYYRSQTHQSPVGRRPYRTNGERGKSPQARMEVNNSSPWKGSDRETSPFNRTQTFPPPPDLGDENLVPYHRSSVCDPSHHYARQNVAPREKYNYMKDSRTRSYSVGRLDGSTQDYIDTTAEYSWQESHGNGQSSSYQDSTSHMYSHNFKARRMQSPANNGFHHMGSPHHFLERKEAENSAPVELLVSNLDQFMDANEMKQVLYELFAEHVMVLRVSVMMQSDHNYAAIVTLNSQDDAQYSISKLQRFKIGSRKISIQPNVKGRTPSPELLRSQVLAILQDVPHNRLQLFKFRDLFEKRYQQAVNVGDLNKIKDIVTIKEDAQGRTVALADPGILNTAVSPLSVASAEEAFGGVCPVHYPPDDSDEGWAEKKGDRNLPNVHVSLKILGQCVHSLLQSHDGKLPLASLVHCYTKEAGELEIVEEPDGVPLERLVGGIPGLQIVANPSGYKIIQWMANKEEPEIDEYASVQKGSLADERYRFSREVVDLLKTFPGCHIGFSRFIPAYHHHFGKQCRVADYGYTKLMDLLLAIPNVVQVMGEGSKQCLTLTHKAQVRRFTSDLLRILKSHASKEVRLSSFSELYEKILLKPLKVTDYGVCYIDDLLKEVPETTVVMSSDGDDTVIALPKREQTPEEKELTKYFALEAREILRHAPHYLMSFVKFIPAYHHHYSKQCRVSDYGFTKLIELVEAVPHTLQVDHDEKNEKVISLSETERLKVFANQMETLINSSETRNGNRSKYVLLSDLKSVFKQQFGFQLTPDLFKKDTIEHVLEHIKDSIKMESTKHGKAAMLVDRQMTDVLRYRVRQLLLKSHHGQMPIAEFHRRFLEEYKLHPPLEKIRTQLNDCIQVQGDYEVGSISLTPLTLFARDAVTLLKEHGGKLPLSDFEANYAQRFGVKLYPAEYGFSNLQILLLAIPSSVVVRGKSRNRFVMLNRESPDLRPPPASFYKDCERAKKIPACDGSQGLERQLLSIVKNDQNFSTQTSKSVAHLLKGSNGTVDMDEREKQYTDEECESNKIWQPTWKTDPEPSSSQEVCSSTNYNPTANSTKDVSKKKKGHRLAAVFSTPMT